jgi:hypothetical protein
MTIFLKIEFLISTINTPMAALQCVQCEILKQYLIGTSYATEFLYGGESVQVTMSVYSQFLGKRKYLGKSADVLVKWQLFINYFNMLHAISIVSHFTYQRMLGKVSLQLQISIT